MIPNANKTAPKSLRGRFWFLASAVILFMTAIWMVFSGSKLTQLARSVQSETPNTSQAANDVGANTDKHAESELPPNTPSSTPATMQLPASLQGSTPDGEITLDAQGNLLINRALRRWFDYFLTATGELSATAIRNLVLINARQAHGELIAAQVLSVFDRYVACLQALSKNMVATADPHTQLSSSMVMQKQMLGSAVAEAFFGEEWQYTNYTLQRLDLLRNEKLSADERQIRLNALDQTQDPSSLQMKQESTASILVEEQNRQFEQLKINPESRHAERAQLFGTDAADRLAALDAERNQWQARIDDYVKARDRIRQQSSWTKSEREAQIRQLQFTRFNANELKRIQGLEAVGAL